MSNPSKKMSFDPSDCATVTILPESEDEFLVLRLQGVITLEDFNRCFYDEAAKRIEQFGRFSMLVYFSAQFQSWAIDAADASFRSILEMGHAARKLAYVNPPERKVLQMSLQRPMVSNADIKYFEPNQFDEAVQWLKS